RPPMKILGSLGRRRCRRLAELPLVGQGDVEPRSSNLFFQQAATGENDVPNNPEPKAGSILPCHKPIGRDAIKNLAPNRRGLPVSGRADDLTNECLAAPAGSNEFVRQPVEQLRVSRGIALMAKIRRSPNQAEAEQPLPSIVDRHA